MFKCRNALIKLHYRTPTLLALRTNGLSQGQLRNYGTSQSCYSNIFETQDFLKEFSRFNSSDEAALATLYNNGRSSGVLHEHNIFNVREALCSMKGGTICAMKLRDTATSAQDKKMSDALRLYLESCFSMDTLEFRRLTFEDSPGLMLERVAEKDSVLARVRTLRELKKRLGDGRRCYALLHPQLPNDPVVFIHVALTQELANGLPYLDEHCHDHPKPLCAMFYSVNAPHTALGGLDLATKIIKLAAEDLSREFPSVRTFSTLSPIPGFMSWLQKAAQGNTVGLPTELGAQIFTAVKGRGELPSSPAGKITALQLLQQTIANGEWVLDERLANSLRPALEWLGRHYLAKEKAKDAPLDPVARFHLRNGASLHRLNWMGNPSAIGLSRSAGMMVNYMYDLSKLRERSLLFPSVHVNPNF
jgi:malonyl-CoA decarboxylase